MLTSIMKKAISAIGLTAVLLTGCGQKHKDNDQYVLLSEEKPPDYVGNKYSKLLIEIDYDTNSAPDDVILDMYKQIILEHIQPKEITFKLDKIARLSQDDDVNLDQIINAETMYRNEKTKNNTVTLHILWLKEQMPNFAGYNYTSSAFAVFMAEGNDHKYTLPVLVHETGHIFGLVDNGARMQTDHLTTNSPHHCTTDSCVMRPELYLIGDNTDFCVYCEKDLKEIGGR